MILFEPDVHLGTKSKGSKIFEPGGIVSHYRSYHLGNQNMSIVEAQQPTQSSKFSSSRIYFVVTFTQIIS